MGPSEPQWFLDEQTRRNTMSIIGYDALSEVKEHGTPVNTRLDEETNSILEKTARALRTTKSEVLRRSLQPFRVCVYPGKMFLW